MCYFVVIPRIQRPLRPASVFELHVIRCVDDASQSGVHSLANALYANDGVERISTFQNKAHQGIHLCLGDSEKV